MCFDIAINCFPDYATYRLSSSIRLIKQPSLITLSQTYCHLIPRYSSIWVIHICLLFYFLEFFRTGTYSGYLYSVYSYWLYGLYVSRRGIIYLLSVSVVGIYIIYIIFIYIALYTVVMGDMCIGVRETLFCVFGARRGTYRAWAMQLEPLFGSIHRTHEPCAFSSVCRSCRPFVCRVYAVRKTKNSLCAC